MVIRFEGIHIVGRGETLAGLAETLQLSSWRAIYHAPENRVLRAAGGPERNLEEGQHLVIPPNAQFLLKERLAELYKLSHVLRAGLDGQAGLLDRRLGELSAATPGMDAIERLIGMAEDLASHARDAIERCCGESSEIAYINRGLRKTHIGLTPDLDDVARWQFESPGLEGLYWVVTGELLELWNGLWSGERLKSRADQLEAGGIGRAARLDLQMTRSRLLQQLSQRIRETQQAMTALAAETR